MMNPRILTGVTSLGAAVLLFAWFLPGLLGLSGTQLWLLRGGLALFGLAATAILGRILQLRMGRSTPSKRDPGIERIDETLAEARRRLGQAGSRARRLEQLPAVLVIGPPASTKTTAILESGLDPVLLAGEVKRDDAVVPTEGANLWFADGMAIVEASGDLMSSSGPWQRLIEKLRPARLRAALLRARQAPRVAVLCVATDEFFKPGASRSVPELARQLRERLTEASELLGIHLPVYVLFTRADRLPYFEEFARTLSHQEAAEVLGATLPFRSFDSSSSYAEGQNSRLARGLDGIRRGLARKRLDLLEREGSEEVRQAAYEFPREMQKLADPVREFLLELCRPSHMGPAPFLRGFYFSGVRAVFLDDPGLEEAPRSAPMEEAPADTGATGVFRAMGQSDEGPESPAPARSSGSRKVPQWVFLPGVFQKVLLADQAAMGVTTTGSRVSLVRRVFLTGVALAALVTCVGMTVSFLSNRGLQSGVAEQARAVEALNPDGSNALPSLAELQQLEELGVEVDQLRRWNLGSPPLRYRWGLYRGDELLGPARDVYMERFRGLLWEDTRGAVLGFLRDLPDEPDEDSDYERSYNALKAHLMTTRHPEESEPGFLTPVLVSHLNDVHPGLQDTEESVDLVWRQFDRFARELAVDPPWTEAANEPLVASTRTFMGEFAAGDRFYQALVSAVSADLGRVEITRGDPGQGSTLRQELSVPGAYSREGWARVHEILDDPDALLVSEEWVVGEQVVTPEERTELALDLGERYRSDFLALWQGVLTDGGVRNFASVSQAANALHTLSGNDSPIWRILESVNRNTRVDSEAVRTAFQPVHHLLPPTDPEDEESEADPEMVREYLDDLMALQASLDQLPGASGARLDQGVVQAERDASQAGNTVARLSRDFERSGQARVIGDQVERLLNEPIRYTSSLLDGFEAAQAAGGINARGQDFCSRYDAALRGFPFEAGSTSDADMDEVKALLTPGESRLESFHQDVMDDLVTRQGGRWEARSGASPAPTSQFLSFYNHAHRLSDVLFSSDGSGPRVDFFLRMEASGSIPEIEVHVDGQSQVFTQTQAPTRDFAWEGERAQSARLDATIGGQTVTVAEASGPWGLFRLFGQADSWDDLGGGTHRVGWSVPGQDLTVSAELTLGGSGTPVFRPDGLQGPRCVPEIVR